MVKAVFNVKSPADSAIARPNFTFPASTKADDIVIIGTKIITKNIEMVKERGNAITAEAVRESVVRSEDGETITEVPPRGDMYVAKAPQSFHYGEVMELYERARKDGNKSIDSSHLCSMYDEYGNQYL